MQTLKPGMSEPCSEAESVQQWHQHHCKSSQGLGSRAAAVLLVLAEFFVCTPFHQGEVGQRAGAGEHWGTFAQCTVAAATREM